MISKEEIHPAIKEWMFAREMMRKLGFTADELMFIAQTSGWFQDDEGRIVEVTQPIISLEVNAQRKKFIWTIGTVDMSKEQLQTAFEQACEYWNTSADDLRDEYMKSHVLSKAIPLLHALRAKGFQIVNDN